MAFAGHSAFAEEVAVDVRRVAHLPANFDAVIGSAFMLTYGTALHALKDRGRLEPGETVAVLGAAGGAGLAAVEIAKLMGGQVIAVASSEEKLALAREHGAALGIDYATEDLKKRLRELTDGKGVDIVYDCVGGPHAEPALRSTAWEGRYLVLGFAAGEIPRPPLNLVLLKGCAIIGVFWTAFVARNPERHRANTALLLDWVKQGRIAPHVHASFPLAETAKALSLIEGRKVQGKLIVKPQL
jgi:NADPH2:quinone reductase